MFKDTLIFFSFFFYESFILCLLSRQNSSTIEWDNENKLLFYMAISFKVYLAELRVWDLGYHGLIELHNFRVGKWGFPGGSVVKTLPVIQET